MHTRIQDPVLLDMLLLDQTRLRNGEQPGHIIWATDIYEQRGEKYRANAPITADLLGKDTIVPRTRKSKEEHRIRSRDKAEVFSPSWICNCQNNLIDAQWFGGITGLFNSEDRNGWTTNPSPLPFPTASGKTWQDYVKDPRLEITCGEAPYLASRYDTISGMQIPVPDRIGLLDRKLRVISENTGSPEEWTKWALEAFKSIYGYEWQGDNLLLARQNLLLSYIEHFRQRFKKDPPPKSVRQVATVISWNLWQMDGLKGVLPDSCHEQIEILPSLFGDGEKIVSPCPGCERDDIRKHNGTYCYIKDWSARKTIRFIDLIK